MSELFESADSAAGSVLGEALEAGALGPAGAFGELAAIGDAVLQAAGDITGTLEKAGDAVLVAAGDAAGSAEAMGDSLLQAAGDIAGQAEQAGRDGLAALGDLAGKAEAIGDSLLQAAGDITLQAAGDTTGSPSHADGPMERDSKPESGADIASDLRNDFPAEPGEHGPAQAISGEHPPPSALEVLPSGLEMPALTGERADQNRPTEEQSARDGHAR
jgi:hypothetical protein